MKSLPEQGNDFIPAHQSAAEDSIIARSYECGQRLSGSEQFQLKGIDGRYHLEAKKVNIGDEMCLLSLCCIAFHKKVGQLENFPNRLRGGDSTCLEDQATASLTVTRRQLYTVVMSAKDIIHDAVKNALIKDGWHITNDPLTIVYEDATVFADLGAERIIAAERGTERIAVEIKSFVGVSALHELEIALGQYILYLNLLAETDSTRKLYVAISDVVYETIFQRPSFLFMRERVQMPLIVTDVEQEVILKWVN